MQIKTTRERLLASSMICGAALLGLFATAAAAQTNPAAGEVSEIVVTGSRIPQPNLTSISPVQVVGSQEILQGGRPATIDILNQLPQVTQNAAVDLGPTSNPLSGPGGVATVNLRGLGPQRTLVLVNGRRLGVGDPNTGNSNPAPDINQIPSQLIDHIEVLTGGASAVYGSDAVAGVVNFVMKKNFEGIQIDAQFGVNQHNQHNDLIQGLERAATPPVAIPGKEWDGKSYDFSILFGMNAPDRKGNVTTFFTYHQQQPVQFSHRDFAACQVNVSAAGVPSCAGSVNSNQLLSADGSFAGNFAVSGSSFVPYSATAATTPPPRFNSNPYEYLIQDSTRYTGGYFANYEINKNFELYSDFSFMHDRTEVQIAPSALFQGSGAQLSGGFLVNCNNPLMSAQQRGVIGCTPAQIASGATKDLLIARRNIEGGGRLSTYEHQNYRVLGGSRGNLFGPFNYDLYGSYYYTTFAESKANYLSIKGIQDALLVDGTAANPVCISRTTTCVPYNIFTTGAITPAQAGSLALLGTSRGAFTQRIVEGTITGSLEQYGVKSPYARDAVGVSIGFQQRRDHLSYAPDAAEESGDLSGAGGASVRVDRSLRAAEAFAEVRIPLVQDMTFMRELLLEGGYRYSDYSTGIQAKTYKIGFQWEPIEDIRFRGSYNQAIRAPNILELYTPQYVTNTSEVSEDPCAQGFSGVRPSLAACQRTGVTAAQYNGFTIPQCPAGQCAVLQGGNANLEAEEAKTYTIGFTSRPRWVEGLTFSADYFHIELTGGIDNVPLATSLTQCLNTGLSIYCNNVVRNPSNGILFGTVAGAGGYIDGALTNVASSVTAGVDFQANYRLPMEAMGIESWGGLSFNLGASWLLESSKVPLPGNPSHDCVGLFGPSCAHSVNPNWRHTLRMNWTTPWYNTSFSLAWRYLNGTRYEQDTNEPNGIGKGAVNKFNHTLPERSYVDLSGMWKVNDTVTVRGGVNNLFDQDPPLINSSIVGTGLPNTFPTYDLLGRHLFFGVTANF